MKITRYVNGKPISEEVFRNIAIKNPSTEKIISEGAKRAGSTEIKDAE